MARFFNTTGPCDAADHYMLPPEQRLPDLLPFVEQKLYFVVHSARQTGKTTAMIAFAERLRRLGYAAVYATLETSQGRETVEEAEPGWLSHLRRSASIQLPPHQQPPAEVSAPPGERLGALLEAWGGALRPTPLVLLLDEVDVICGGEQAGLHRRHRAGARPRLLHHRRAHRRGEGAADPGAHDPPGRAGRAAEGGAGRAHRAARPAGGQPVLHPV